MVDSTAEAGAPTSLSGSLRFVPVGQEAEETLEAIVLGEVDALLIESPEGPRVYILKDANEPYRLLAERMSEAAIVLSENGIILYCNGRLQEWLRPKSGDAMTGCRFDSMIAPAHGPRLSALLAAATRFPAAAQIDLVGPGQVRRMVRLSAARMEFDDQPCIALVATDLSSLQRSEQVERNADLAATILEQATQAIIVCDLDGVVTHANRAATALCDAFPIGQAFSDAFALRPPELFGRALANRLADGIVASMMRAGSPYYFLASGAPLYDPKGAVVGCVIALADITGLKMAELAAEKANDAKTRFLASISHDLRQPLQAQRFQLFNLTREATTPAQTNACAQMAKTIDVTEAMLSRLMDFATLESGNAPVAREIFCLDELVQTVLDEVDDDAFKKGLEIRQRMFPCWTDSDPVLLGRILRNLITNAIRYADHGVILVSIRRRGAALRIEVWDTGKGVPPEQQQAIFGAFGQLDNPERNPTKGHGLGLAIVARTAELLGHKLCLRSVVGRGSVFAIDVPQACRPAPPQATTSSGVVLDAPGATILVVEDDAIQADALDALFTGYGYDVIIAHDADEALVAVPARLDLIVSDYRLPKHKTGVDVVVSLRQATGRSIPAIVMTGDAQANIALEVARAGCEIIHKPCMPNLLVKAVFRVLSSSCG